MFIVEIEVKPRKWVQEVPPVQYKDLHDAATVAHRFSRHGKRARVVELVDESVS